MRILGVEQGSKRAFGVFGLFEAVGGQSDTTQEPIESLNQEGVSLINWTRVGLYVWFEYELFVVDCITGKA